MIKNLDCDIYLYKDTIPDDVNIVAEFEELFKKYDKK